MADNDSRRPDEIQPITQPQLPSSGVTLVRDTGWPGKVFDLTASQLRRAYQDQPELYSLIQRIQDAGSAEQSE